MPRISGIADKRQIESCVFYTIAKTKNSKSLLAVSDKMRNVQSTCTFLNLV